MKRVCITVWLLMVASVAYAGGPKWEYPKEPLLNDEMRNIYHDIINVPNGIYKASSMTIQGITVDSETVKYKLTIPNGSAATDAIAFGQLQYFVGPVQGTLSSTFATTSSAYQATGLKAVITPTSASHRIKVTASYCWRTGDGNNTGVTVTLKRSGTDLAASAAGFQRWKFNTTVAGESGPGGFTYTDSPASTSSLTYELYIKNDDNSTSISIQVNGETGVVLAEEVL